MQVLLPLRQHDDCGPLVLRHRMIGFCRSLWCQMSVVLFLFIYCCFVFLTQPNFTLLKRETAMPHRSVFSFACLPDFNTSQFNYSTIPQYWVQFLWHTATVLILNCQNSSYSGITSCCLGRLPIWWSSVCFSNLQVVWGRLLFAGCNHYSSFARCLQFHLLPERNC